MIFNGNDGIENVDISANGSRVRFTRSPGNIVMDLNGIESVDFNAFGGADRITVNDLSGTDLTEVNLNLFASNTLGDDAADSVVVNGTNGDDVIQMFGDASSASIFGLAAIINVATIEPADTFTINALGGDDVIQASGSLLPSIQNGGEGNDILIGGDANDTMNGGAGDDVLVGNAGQDVLDGGAGNNVLFQ
jgi:Ca2+-binding RTX toxin-like protein